MRPEDYQQARCQECGLPFPNHAGRCAEPLRFARSMQNVDPYGPFVADQYSPYSEQTQRLNWTERQRGLANSWPEGVTPDFDTVPEPRPGFIQKLWRWLVG